ncbi:MULTISPECIES: OmpA family protein [unclassified Flavobacterium]|uniref:OmpA family protein n=1 Tax=unclassified Flavobacterium TaxID=196869 RepID=UPI001F140A51|nr:MULTISPECIES: OmpA family protein [unclassified Flavobacterium]UMY66268.1 OmpA family protein [Flavobacterium sp. HJ-32-4]
MKKTALIFSFVLAAAFSVQAQNRDTETADKLFRRLEYVDAAKEYESLVEKKKGSSYVYKQLAEAYYNMFNPKEAAKWYARIINEPQDAETYFKYAQMLKMNGKYEEANKWMKKFASMAPSDQRAVEFMKNPDYLPKLLDKSKAFNVKTMAINSPESDFGPVLSNDNFLYFTSARNKSRKTYGWNDEPYLDMYQAVRNADGSYAEPTPITGINSKWHDGPATISADGKTMYFSSESFKEKEYVKDRKVKNAKLNRGQVYIYKATKTGDGWGNVKEVPFNNKEYSTGNPSLSKDGKTLYFSSDMPGGFGGSDIWKVSINGDTYGTPENLGKMVNTEGSENFPSITDEGLLYYASNGKPGLGGLDIFVFDTKKPAEATNLGKPVNSEKDDFSFSFNTAQNIGFLASNRSGSDDLYIADPICSVEATVMVTNAKTGQPIDGARVAILDDKKNVIETRNSDSNGAVVYTVECNKSYTVQAMKDGFESGTFGIDKNKGGKVEVPAALNPIDVIVTETEIILKDIFFEYNKSNITPQGAFELDKLVQVLNNNPNMVILVKSHTDNRGSDKYNLDLSERRAKSTVAYVISKGISKDRISGKGYGESEPKVDCKEACTEEQHAMNRRSEFLIVKK